MTEDDPNPIHYGGQSVDEADIEAVVEVLESDWLTTGPKVETFEEAFAEAVDAEEAVALANGTAALHAAMRAANVGQDDDVLVPTMTFAASANAALFEGATPILTDVRPGTLLADPERVLEAVTPETEAVVAVDYTGQPSDYAALREICADHDLTLVADACHALGGRLNGDPVGSLADLNAFSFHPVKNMTTGEGGMVTTDDPDLAEVMRVFRNHGITSDHRDRAERGSWYYEMEDLGYNYRLSDIHCALGLTQLEKLPGFVERRRQIAATYDQALDDVPGIEPLEVRDDAAHAYHLYVVRVREDEAGLDRDALFDRLRDHDIHANVHYIPVHLHPHYRNRLGTGPGDHPVAEEAYDEILSLPIHPCLEPSQVERVTATLAKVVPAATTPPP